MQGSEMQIEMTELVNAGLLRAKDAGNEHAEPSLCPMSSDFDRPESVEDLVRCPEYRSSSCCSKAEDEALDEAFRTAYEYVYGGCEGCVENFRLFACAAHCSPEQIDFVSVEAADDDGAVEKRVRICPQFCERFYSSCVNTTARHITHADDLAFCVAQDIDVSSSSSSPSSSSSSVVLQIDQNDCTNPAGPTYCNGEYVHEVDDDEELTSQQVVKITIVVAAVVVALFYGIYALCKTNDEYATLREVHDVPYAQTKLLVTGDDPRARHGSVGGGGQADASASLRKKIP
eukprot:g1948.t1